MLSADCPRRKYEDLSTDYGYDNEQLPSDSDYSGEIHEKLFDLTGFFMKSFAFQVASTGINKSLVCSPISALLPLGKLVFGAAGKTLVELLNAIGVENKDLVAKHFKKMFSDMRKLQGVTLSLVSRLYLSQNKTLASEFEEGTKKVFKFSAELVDMQFPEKVVQKVNSWVEEQTNGTIKKILKLDDVSPDMILILVNAIHLKGTWKHPFTEVKPATFYGSNGERKLPMMKVTNYFRYGESKVLDAKIIDIPYSGSEAISFMVVLPNSRHGLPLLIDELRLAPEMLNTIKTTSTHVRLTMPVFKIETEIDLKLLYKKTGLNEIFSRQTGFDHIIQENEKVVVDNARQMAYIEVTATGTEAGASSVLSVQTLSLIRPVNFKVEHPFLFFIMADKQQVFAGIFTAF